MSIIGTVSTQQMLYRQVVSQRVTVQSSDADDNVTTTNQLLLFERCGQLLHSLHLSLLLFSLSLSLSSTFPSQTQPKRYAHSLHCQSAVSMDVHRIDPSLALAFYLPDRAAFEDLIKKIGEVRSPKTIMLLLKRVRCKRNVTGLVCLVTFARSRGRFERC